MTTTRGAKITRDDIEAKLREFADGVDDQAERARPSLVSGAVAGLTGAIIVAYLIGRRGGRRRSAVVEIRRV